MPHRIRCASQACLLPRGQSEVVRAWAPGSRRRLLHEHWAGPRNNVGDRLNRPMAKVMAKLGKPRSDLAAEACEEWNRVVGLLEPVGLLDARDMAVLEVYCVSYAQWREASRVLAAEETE